QRGLDLLNVVLRVLPALADRATDVEGPHAREQWLPARLRRRRRLGFRTVAVFITGLLFIARLLLIARFFFISGLRLVAWLRLVTRLRFRLWHRLWPRRGGSAG